MTRYRETAWNTGKVVTVTVTDLETGAKYTTRFPAEDDSPERREAEVHMLKIKHEA